MKKAVLFLGLLSFNTWAIEVNPMDLTQLQMQVETAQAQLDQVNMRLQALLASQASEDFAGSCNTDLYTSIGGTECPDIENVLRRPNASVQIKQDIQATIACAQKKAFQNCSTKYGPLNCMVLPGIVSVGVKPAYMGDVSWHCQVSATARSK